MATTFSIVNKHNGHINIDSELGKGTTLTLYLPASESQLYQKIKQPVMEQSKKLLPAKVLIMDDNETLIKVTTIMLKRAGYSVDVAYDGKQAIKIYKQALNNGNKFDVVIMDLIIPNGIGGQEAVKSILEIDPKARVIISSGYSDKPVMANYSDYGFKGVLAKPYTMKRLQDIMTQILNS